MCDLMNKNQDLEHQILSKDREILIKVMNEKIIAVGAHVFEISYCLDWNQHAK